MRWCPSCERETEHRRESHQWQCLVDGCGHSELINQQPRKCDTFGCGEPGHAYMQIAAGTNVWLCEECLYRGTAEREATARIRSRDEDNHHQDQLSSRGTTSVARTAYYRAATPAHHHGKNSTVTVLSEFMTTQQSASLIIESQFVQSGGSKESVSWL